MLKLSRRPGERVIVTGPCIITVLDHRTRLGFTAAESTKVYREEVWERMQDEVEYPDCYPSVGSEQK